MFRRERQARCLDSLAHIHRVLKKGFQEDSLDSDSKAVGKQRRRTSKVSDGNRINGKQRG